MIEILAEINYITVLVSMIAVQAFGFLWYGKLFGKPWMKLAHIDPKKTKKEDMQKAMAGSAIFSLIMVYALAVVISAFSANSPVTGALIGLFLGLGFVVTTIGTNYLYEARSMKLFNISAGYHIASLILAGAILGMWQ